MEGEARAQTRSGESGPECLKNRQQIILAGAQQGREGRAPGRGWRKKSSRPKSDVTVASGRDAGMRVKKTEQGW